MGVLLVREGPELFGMGAVSTKPVCPQDLESDSQSNSIATVDGFPRRAFTDAVFSERLPVGAILIIRRTAEENRIPVIGIEF